MKGLIVLLCFAAVARGETTKAITPFPTARWNALLAKNVDADGRVRYDAVDKAEVERLCASIAATSPSALGTPRAKEAFYLNAYNVLVWKNVLDRLPALTSVDAVKTSFFETTTFLVGGKPINLHDLESAIIRPQFADARVHMALNCASAGCPALPAEAFTAEKLDAQLDREARRFVSEKRNVDWDATTKTVRLSKIFDWYKDDFGGASQKVIAWINRYRATALPIDATITYVPYDWRLNDRGLKR